MDIKDGFIEKEIDKMLENIKMNTIKEVCLFLRSFDYGDATEAVECAYGVHRNIL